MRHRLYGKKLNRSSNQRAGLFKSLVQSLFTSGTITTSKTKAFAIKGMVDKIINLAKNKDTRRLLQTYLTNKQLQQRLVEEIVPKLQNRVSGYTSQVKVGLQHGDKTTMVRMAIIGNETLKPLAKESSEEKAKLTKTVKLLPKTKVTTPKVNKTKIARGDKKS